MWSPRSRRGSSCARYAGRSSSEASSRLDPSRRRSPPDAKLRAPSGAVEMLRLPYLKIVGSLLLFWIAVQLLVPDNGDAEGTASGGTMFAAIRTILIADLVMSLDNVIGVAAAAKGDRLLLILGLAISI